MLDVRAKTITITGSLAAAALAATITAASPAQSTQPALFVVNNSSADSGVTSFTINSDGTLNFVQEVNPPGSLNPQAIDVSPNGRWLIVGHGTISGTVEQLTFLEVHADATMSIVLETTTPDSPVDVLWIDDEYVAVTNTSTSPDQVIVYHFDVAVPSISLVWFSTLSTSTFDIAIDRAHNLLYPRASTSTVWPMRINPDRSLTKLTLNPVPTGIFYLGPNLSPDGSKLYFGGGISGADNSIGGFNIDTATGALTQMPDSPYLSPPADGDAGPSPKEVDVSADGQFAFVNHGGTAHIKGFTVDKDGHLNDIPASYFDVGGQGDSGAMTVLGNRLFVLRRYAGTGGNPPSGVVSLTINPDGTLTPNGATFPTQGGLPWDLVAWPGVPVLCSVDVNGSGAVDVDDLVAVILGWGPCGKPPAECPADVDDSGAVDVDDLIAVILAWGPCT